MKKILILISVLLCFLLIIGFSGCKTVKDIISGKDYGAYTSIVVKIAADYYGMNSTGFRKLTINGNVAYNDKFTIFGTAFLGADCPDEQIFSKSYSVDTTLTSTSMTLIVEFINWDYTKFKKFGDNLKMLCTIWSGSIVSYTYEAGKDDPGTPIISGFDLLNNLDLVADCTNNGRITNCKHEVEITFSSPHTTTDKNASDFVSAISCSSSSSE